LGTVDRRDRPQSQLIMTADLEQPQTPEQAAPPGWNDTATLYERAATIHEVFADRVTERPDAVAVEDHRRSLTYRQLDELAAVVAHDLGTVADGPDQCVGVLVDRSPEAAVALLGILKAGAAFVPLDAETRAAGSGCAGTSAWAA